MRGTANQQPIVVGVDGTEDGLHAVDYAAAESRRIAAPLHLLHVVALPSGVYAPASTASMLRKAGERAVRAARDRAEKAGVSSADIHEQVADGQAVPGLVEAARDARVVVIGRRDMSGFERVFAGSTSVGVSGRADCPVVVVPHKWTGQTTFGRVVVGLDGSARSLPALALAVAEAQARAAELVALRAWQSPTTYYLYDPAVLTSIGAWPETAKLETAETLAGWAEQHPDLTITRVFEHEHPATALVAQSTSADLLVVGARGGGGWHGHSVGSVARAVIGASWCPVLLVRRGPRTPAGLQRHRARRNVRPADFAGPTY